MDVVITLSYNEYTTNGSELQNKVADILSWLDALPKGEQGITHANFQLTPDTTSFYIS